MIWVEFAQSAFRFGHSTMRETIDYMDPNGSITGKVMSIALEKAFLNPQLFADKGAAAIAMGMTHQRMNEIECWAATVPPTSAMAASALAST